jgi:NADH-quinone oxidoreductase subunit M
VLGIVLGAAYLLWLYQRVFWGKVTKDENKDLPDLNARELATLVPLVVLCFWIGLYPKPFLAFLHAPVGRIAAIVQPEKFGGQVAHAADHDATSDEAPENTTEGRGEDDGVHASPDSQ